MKLLQFIILLILPIVVFGQNDTVVYFGVNGKLNNIEQREIKKEIDYRKKNKVKIETFKFNEGNWQQLFTEKIDIENDGAVFKINIKGKEFSESFARVFETENSGYKFTDWVNDNIKRTGHVLSKIPLIFDGEVTEFYPDGSRKSVSIYENNELISNRNWRANGDEYISNIFYSVDKLPGFTPGMGVLHNHVLKFFKSSGIDFSGFDGKMVVGFVVMENGGIDGIKIEEGIGSQINNVAVKAFATLPPNWEPALLDGEKVRYFQLFPINFIYHDYEFDYLDFSGSRLYWEIN